MEYLLLALALIVTGIALVVLRNRRPTGMDASIEEFGQSLDAIAPQQAGAAPQQAGAAPQQAGAAPQQAGAAPQQGDLAPRRDRPRGRRAG